MNKKNFSKQDIIIIAISISIILNFVNIFALYQLKANLNIPINVSSNCNSSSLLKDYLGFAKIYSNQVGEKIDIEGRINQGFTISLSEKVPNSEVFFRYREVLQNGSKSEWQLVMPNEIGALKYEVNLLLKYEQKKIEHHIVQILNNEIIKASEIQRLNFNFSIGDIDFYCTKYANSKKADL